MADNSNTLQLTLQIKEDGAIVIDKTIAKIGQLGGESKKAFEEMGKGPAKCSGPMASLLENWGKTGSTITNVGKETAKTFKDLEGQTQKGTSGLGSFSEGWMGITAKIAGFTAAGYGAYKMLESFVSEAAEAEAIENRLKFALETTGYSWSAAKGAVDEFANSIQATTRFSDDQARQSLTDMMMYTQDFGKAQMGAKLAMDMSIRTGQDLGSTNRMIGMAMSGNAEMLGRYIPELRNLDNVLGANATQAQKAEYALKILQQKFGGTAQADLTTYSGKVAQFKNQWSDLKEEIGKKTLPILGDLLGMLTKVSQRLTLGVGGGTEKTQLEFQLKAWEQRYEILKEQPGFEAEVLEAEEKIWVINEKLAVLYAKIGEDRKKLAAETKKDIFAPGKDEYPEWRAIIGEERIQQEKDYWEAQNKTWAIENKLKEIEGERAQQLADDMFPSQEKVNAIILKGVVAHEKTIEQIKLAAAVQKKEAEEQIKLAEEQIKLAADRLSAYHDLYKDLKGYEGDYYESSKAIVLKQEKDYRNLLIDKNTSAEDAARTEILLAQRTAYELRKLNEEKILRSNDFFAGMKVAMNQNSREQIAWGQVGADVFGKFATDAEKQLSDNLFNVLTGKFDKLQLDWNSLWEGMLRTLTDKIAQMAVEAATAKVFDLLGPAWDWVDWIFAAKGIWDVKGAVEGIPVIAHPGEMIIPPYLARQIREAGGGESFEALQSMIDTMTATVGITSPGLEAFGKGTLEAHKGIAAIGALMTATGKITVDQLMGGLLSPQALAISALKGGLPAAMMSIFGLEPGSKTGFTVLSAAAKVAGLSTLMGIPIGLIGMLLADQVIGYLQDLSTSKTTTTVINTVTEALETLGRGFTAYGYFGLSTQEAMDAAAANAAAYADYAGAQQAADAAAANAPGGDYGWGGSEQGFRKGAIFKGPESGYWVESLKLHGTEAIVPLKNGGGDLTELVTKLIAEVKQLREDLARVNFVIAKNTGKMSKVLSRFDDDGLPPERMS